VSQRLDSVEGSGILGVMDLTSREVHEKQFHDAWRGYNQSEVDDFLDRIAEALERATRENEDLKARVAELDQAMAASRDTEEMLKKTLLTAQRAAEEAIANAKAKAEELISEADAHVQRSEKEARERLSQADAEARRKSAEWERESSARRRDLDERIEKLRLIESDIRQRLKAFLDQQLRAVEALSPGDPSKQPPPQARPAAQRPQPAQSRAGPGQPAPAPAAQPAETAPAQSAAETAEDDSAEQTAPHRRGVRDLFRHQG
jgi:cell division initiation protein